MRFYRLSFIFASSIFCIAPSTATDYKKPLRGLVTNTSFPSGVDLLCSYCPEKILYPPDSINEKEIKFLKKHNCQPFSGTCNPFLCKRFLLSYGARCEMYVQDNKYFVCFRCLKNIRDPNIQLEPMDEDYLENHQW